MNYLIILAHPKLQSFSHEINTKLKENLEKGGRQVKVRDLYKINFNPILTEEEQSNNKRKKQSNDIISEQKYISWADEILFIYPLWWNAFPAILKGYIDRVFTNGFAFHIGSNGPEGLLKGKKVQLITTAGMDEESLIHSSIYEGLKITQDHGVFEFCGMEVREHLYVTRVTSLTAEEKQKVLDKLVKEIVEKERVNSH